MEPTTRLPHGPKGIPVLGSALAFMRDPLRFYQDVSRDYFGLAYARLGSVDLYIASDPALVETLLVGKHRDCVKDVITRELFPLVGNGLITNDGDSWRRQRKLSAPPFQPKHIIEYADVMVECSQRAFATYRHDEQRDFHRDIMALTLEIVGKTLLGFDPQSESERVAQAMEDAIPYFEERLFSLRGLLPRQLPSSAARRFRRAKRELDQVVRAVIARAQNDGSAESKYLLARLIRSRDEDGRGMTEQQVADEAITMLLAGHETTALAVMFCVYELSRNPDIARDVRSEIDTQLAGHPARNSDLPRLPLLDAVIREVLRLYPPAPVFGREVAVPLELGGYDIPRGATIGVSPYAMHRNPRYFPEPDRFHPQRWLSGSTDALPKFAYFPFGGGPRICIGQHFALMEAALILATLLQQVELEVPAGFRMELKPVITLRSRYGLPVRARRREPSEHQSPQRTGNSTQPEALG